MQRDRIDYASAAGSIATALTLIYLVVKEWEDKKAHHRPIRYSEGIARAG